MGGFDLLWDDGPIFVEDTGLDYAVAGAPPLNNSFLGEHKFVSKFHSSRHLNIVFVFRLL